MNFDQLVAEIFTNYYHKHHDILCDITATSQQTAKRILAKYNTKKLSTEQLDELKKMIVQKEVDEFLNFVESHKDILDAHLSDNEKFRLLFERCDHPDLTDKERTLLKKRIRRHIYDDGVGKTLANLWDKLNKPQSPPQ